MKRFTLIAFFFALWSVSSALAQNSTLRGVITDSTGAVVQDATVIATGPGGSTKTTTSGSDGSYTFVGLPSGDYTVRVTAPDLSLPKPAAISLRSATQTLNLQLKIATTTQQVTVQDNAGPAVNTDPSANASALILHDEDLQALSDDPEDLQSDLQALAGPSAGPNGGSIFIDGFSGGELPPKESIREIRINQNPFSPEYDKLGYGRIEIFTKPGMDKLRGSVSYNFMNEALNSRNPYAQEKAPLRLNEFQGNVGGPLGKRMSFTIDAQRHMVDNGSIINGVVIEPTTLTPNPFTDVFKTPQRRTRITPRLDYQINDKNTLTFRYSLTKVDIQDAGIGAFDLTSRGYSIANQNQTVQVTETAVLGTTINETRFQYFRTAMQNADNLNSPEIQVLGSFNGGGGQQGQSFDRQNSFELQNYTTRVKGAHTWKWGVRMRGATDSNGSLQNFGGTWTFAGGLAPQLDANNQPVIGADGNPVLLQISSIERYRRTLLFQQLGYTTAQMFAAGGGPTQFAINAGTPDLGVHQEDVSVFVGDDWKVRPNFTLSLGVRYEAQNNIHDWGDVAPRVGFAWAPGGSGGQSRRPKLVLRGGFGMFYDRFALANTLTAERFNGVVQQQFLITDPSFYPNIPPIASLGGAQGTQITQQIDKNYHSPYIMQSAFTVERQLPANTTLAVTYTNSRSLHVLRSEDINAPLPGTFNPAVPGSGVYPFDSQNPMFLMTSSGVYNQNQLITNVNSRMSRNISLFGFYVLNHAKSNSDGLNTFPANPYNYAGEYADASTDIRHRVFIGGSLNTRWNLRLSPFITMQSGMPFNITTGRDIYGTTLFNSRPGIANDPTKPGLIMTPYGLLDPNPTPDEEIVARNLGRGPGQYSVNMRLSKTWGFGPEPSSGGNRAAAAAGGGGGGGRGPGLGGGPGGGGPGGMFAPPTTSHRYNLTLSLSARNLLNHNNPGPIIGNITSPLFGQANQIGGGGFGGGGGGGGQGGGGVNLVENASNRRLELQLRLTF